MRWLIFHGVVQTTSNEFLVWWSVHLCTDFCLSLVLWELVRDFGRRWWGNLLSWASQNFCKQIRFWYTSGRILHQSSSAYFRSVLISSFARQVKFAWVGMLSSCGLPIDKSLLRVLTSPVEVGLPFSDFVRLISEDSLRDISGWQHVSGGRRLLRVVTYICAWETKSRCDKSIGVQECSCEVMGTDDCDIIDDGREKRGSDT